MTVGIVVDSAASLPRDLAGQLGIAIVPMTLVLDDRPVPDHAIDHATLLERLAHGPIETSGPNPAEFLTAIRDAHGRFDEVLVLTLSTEMSSTFGAATAAAREDAGPTQVIDTRSAAGGEGLVALAAAGCAHDGGSLAEVATAARAVIDRVHVVACVDDLASLARSGRVPDIAQRAATTFQVKPLFEFREGTAHALTPAHGTRAATRHIVQRCLDDRPHPESRLHSAILQGEDPAPALDLQHVMLQVAPDADWFVGSFGPVMLAHVGPHLFGLAWWWEG
ncbi:MAG: DegV family protein [Acidimicrobiia bacterium]